MKTRWMMLAALAMGCDDGGGSTPPLDADIDLSDAASRQDQGEMPDEGLADQSAPRDAHLLTDAVSDDGPVDRGTDSALDMTSDQALDMTPDQALDMPPDQALDMGPVDPLVACRESLQPALNVPMGATDPWAGSLAFGQTHITTTDDERIAPRWIAERETAVVFTPDAPVAADADIRLIARQGETVRGVLQLDPPGAGIRPLEAALTTAATPTAHDDAWTTTLPWAWVQNGLQIEVRLVQADAPDRSVSHTFADLGAPHRFTVSRTQMVLFGEPDYAAQSEPSERIAFDFFGALPFAELRWVDTSPWRLDEMVVATPDGPRLVRDENERLDLTDDANHWTILKHQLALRSSLANTGRGLVLTGPSQGDNSPYSLGTSVGMGWYRNAAGDYLDIDDAGLAAGWTGWTAMWAAECGNGFIHEVGHSFTLAHFVDGTAERWGVGAEYPDDGTYVAAHPLPYDGPRRQTRTWYRVNANGPVMDGDTPVGKRDPMNGGEAPNALTCFPPYTAYHARKTQRWAQDAPVIANVDGEPGVYRWQNDRYVAEAPAADHQTPIGVDVPVYTVIGTLGARPEANRVYPPIHNPSGNLFDWPTPDADALPAPYAGARYVIEVEYADGSAFALIARGLVEGNDFALYSLNIDATRDPERVRLHRTAAGYPNIDLAQTEVLHTVEINPPERLRTPLHVGRGQLANGRLQLTTRCEPGINCATRASESTWRTAAPIWFGDADPVTCAVDGATTAIDVMLVDANGRAHPAVLHAQRVSRAGAEHIATAMHDQTPWLSAPNQEQSLRIWLPFVENADLPAGRYTTAEPFAVPVWQGGDSNHDVLIEVDFEALRPTPVDLSMEYRSPPLQTADSSAYFLPRDRSIGPADRVWWEDGEAGAPILSVPVIDENGAPTVLRVRGEREACGRRYDLHAGRGAGNCEHRAILWVEPGDNPMLMPGATYRTPASAPLVLEGRRWHDPGARTLLGTLALDLEYTHAR